MNAEAINVLTAQRKASVAHRADQETKYKAFCASGNECGAEMERMDIRIKAIDLAIQQLSKGK